MENIDNIKADYNGKALLYSDFCKELVNQLNFLIDEKGIHPGFPIEYRIKTIDSILEKIERNNLSISKIEELSDFGGIRIICLFYKDLALIEEILKENLIIHKTENMLSRLGDNVFGYESIHFEGSPKSEWLKIPTFKKHASCNVEIQLRTAAQHIWAAVSHTLQYKKEGDIPLELRRTINRAAALLETVDLEFERVQLERNKYSLSLTESDERQLNIDTLKFILDQKLPAENRAQDEQYSKVLEDLFYFDIRTTTQLSEILDKNMAAVIKANEEVIKLLNNGNKIPKVHGFMHSGFVRRALREEFGKKGEKYFDQQYSFKLPNDK